MKTEKEVLTKLTVGKYYSATALKGENDDKFIIKNNACSSLSPEEFLKIAIRDAKIYLDPNSFIEFELELRQKSLAIQISAALFLYRKKIGLSASRVSISGGLSRAALNDLEDGVGKVGPRISSIQKYLHGISGSLSMTINMGDHDVKILIMSKESPDFISSKIVREIRNISGMTQTSIEKKISSPGGFLSRIENQRGGSVCIGTISKIADACGVSISNIEVLNYDSTDCL
jgi:transcriptional regulator with XRE-family HTH domain